VIVKLIQTFWIGCSRTMTSRIRRFLLGGRPMRQAASVLASFVLPRLQAVRWPTAGTLLYDFLPDCENSGNPGRARLLAVA